MDGFNELAGPVQVLVRRCGPTPPTSTENLPDRLMAMTDPDDTTLNRAHPRVAAGRVEIRTNVRAFPATGKGWFGMTPVAGST
jgi:hypothetical protein